MGISSSGKAELRPRGQFTGTRRLGSRGHIAGAPRRQAIEEARRTKRRLGGEIGCCPRHEHSQGAQAPERKEGPGFPGRLSLVCCELESYLHFTREG